MSDFFDIHELNQLGFKSIGSEVKIARNSQLIGLQNISIGSNVRIDSFCSLIASAGFLSIGNNVHIASGVHLSAGGGIEIQDFAGISAGSIVLSKSEDFSGNFLINPTVPEEFKNVTSGKITLEKHSIIGANSTVLPGVTISKGAVVGANSLVKNTIPADSIYAGSPAKYIKPRNIKYLELEKEYLLGNS